MKSNYEVSKSKNGDRWLPLSIYPEFAHYDVNIYDGRVLNRKTGQECARFAAREGSQSLIVALSPAKGTHGIARNLRVDRLVYEAYHKVRLPVGIRIKRRNSKKDDYSIENLYVDGLAVNDVPPTTVTMLPTITVNGSEPSQLSDKQRRWLERYHKHIQGAVTVILSLSESDGIKEIDALNLYDEDWIDVLEELPKEQLVNFIMWLIKKARDK